MGKLEKCILGIVAAAGIWGIYATSAEAQAGPPPCAPTAEFIAKLKEKYNETEVGGGIVNEQAVVIALASPDGATWTLLGVGANGQSCMISSGTDWFIGVLPEAPVEGERPA